MIASVSMPKATANISTSATLTPRATPRAEKRALRVTTGIASQASVGVSMSPVSATAPAIAISLRVQAPNSRYSGRAARGVRRSAIWKTPAASASGISVHKPSHGPQASRTRAITPIDARRTGPRRCSMSSSRSRSMSSRQSHDLAAMSTRSATGEAPLAAATWPAVISAHEARGDPPHHRHHGRRPRQRRLLRARARPAPREEDRQSGRPDRLPPLLRGREGQRGLRPHLLRVPGRAARPRRRRDGAHDRLARRRAPRRSSSGPSGWPGRAWRPPARTGACASPIPRAWPTSWPWTRAATIR